MAFTVGRKEKGDEVIIPDNVSFDLCYFFIFAGS